MTASTHPAFEDLEEPELTDSELQDAETGTPWLSGGDSFSELLGFEQELPPPPTIPAVTPSQFTEFAFRMPTGEGGTYEPFSFAQRRHMRRPYDSPTKRILLFCGRQVEKSTMLGNIMLCYCCMIQAFRILYVSPSATQTKVFSVDRIKEPIETSDVLKMFTTTMLSQNVFEKQFVNRSKITLRYAFLNADRTRGIPAYKLMIDELQDILTDNIPVIEQCVSHAPEEHQSFIYSGTPKSLDNTIETYRAQKSTQGEWVIPCDRCGSKVKGASGRYWNILGEKNIQRAALSCERCHQPINAMHPEARWAFMTAWDEYKAPWESYRIPQLMVPWRPWKEILYAYQNYSRDRFYNEVLGISYDSGLRPLTLSQMRDACNKDVSMYPEEVEKYRPISAGHPIFAGIDWGSGEHSYTVLSLGTYMNGKFRIFYIHRFSGEEVDPQLQLQRICEMLRHFNVRIIATDYGGGFYPNDHLMRTFGPQRVHKFQYMAKNKKKVEWDGRLMRWKVHRTEVMSDFFNGIKRQQLEFPRWEEFQDPYGNDFLNIFSEYNETQRMIQYKHGLDKPDDAFHSSLYCFLGSMIITPRPDIIAPRKEQGETGPVYSSYSGPTNQS